MSVLSKDVLGIIYIELQLRCDAVSFRLVCRWWNKIGIENNRHRINRYKKTCCVSCVSGMSISTTYSPYVSEWTKCNNIGEYLCESCQKNTMCSTDYCISCVRCYRKICQLCCVDGAPACIKCVPTCEHGDSDQCDICDKDNCDGCNKITISCRDTARKSSFSYCWTCDKVACSRCTGGWHCGPKNHEIHTINAWQWRLYTFGKTNK